MRNFYISPTNELHEILADPVDTIPSCPFHVTDEKTWKLFYANQAIIYKVHLKLTVLQYWMAVVVYLVERNLSHT